MNDLARKAYSHAAKFYTDRPWDDVHKKLLEEVEEFVTAARNHRFSDIDEIPYFDKELFEEYIKDTEADELADIMIVCLAYAYKMGYNIEKHVDWKIKYNKERK